MATIRPRKQSDGTTRYCAIVRIRRNGVLLHHEAKTFAHRGAAHQWSRSREVELENPAALRLAQEGTQSLRELIRWYIDTFQSISKWQRSKQTHLEFLERHRFSKVSAVTLSTELLIDHVRSRRADGAGPATVMNDLVWIGVVLRAARSVKGFPVNPQIVLDARNACRELRLTAKSKRRTRRPTASELQRLTDFFNRRDARSDIPMTHIMWFAVHSARRESEICRLRWADNDDMARTGLVTDAKHPTQRDGNHRRFKFTQEAWQIVQAQPRTSKYIFPYDPRSVGAAFTRACAILGIIDLHFHDLRHEATSRLFERGYQIHEVAQFTLHDSWNELKRYANLRPELLREIPAPTPVSTAADDPRVSETSAPYSVVEHARQPGLAGGR
jgi:integrase